MRRNALVLCAVIAATTSGLFARPVLGMINVPSRAAPAPTASHDAAPPGVMSFQGRLTDPGSGTPVADGSYAVSFRIFDAPAGGTILWLENQSVPVSGGLFSVLLGSVSPLSASIFSGVPRYLEVQVGADPPMTPRQPFGSVAFAFHAELLDGRAATGFWQTGGNAGTNPAADFIGTTDGQPVELRVGGNRALRLEPNATSPNVIGGHAANSVTAGVPGASIAGGGTVSSTNRVTDEYGAVGGGRGNTAGDGSGTTANATGATVGGGQGNTASGARAVVGGGLSNTALGSGATVGGGTFNQATDGVATVGGGQANEASALAATVGGGQSNTASGDAGTVGGGIGNTASSTNSTISGGNFNNASGEYAAIGGGNVNAAAGANGSVPGGYGNTANGDYSFAAGRFARVSAAHDGAFLFADSGSTNFNSAAADEFAVRATGGTRIVSAVDGGGVPTAGVQLAPGAGAWSTLSDRSAKANFAAVDGRSLLERLAGLPIETWNLRTQDESVRHIGPTAQDFSAAFGVGEDERHISTVDADGVALAASQALYTLVEEQEARIAALEDERGGVDGLSGPSDGRWVSPLLALVCGAIGGVAATVALRRVVGRGAVA
jgi:hypothetical protein